MSELIQAIGALTLIVFFIILAFGIFWAIYENFAFWINLVLALFLTFCAGYFIYSRFLKG